MGLEIVGEAAIGNELLAQLPGVEATVVPFDLGLSGPDAFALLAALREQCLHLHMHWPAESSPTSITWRRLSIWEPTATSSKTRCHRSFCTAWARWRLAGRLLCSDLGLFLLNWRYLIRVVSKLVYTL